MTTFDLIQLINTTTKQNSLISMNYLDSVGYNFNSQVADQSHEVADTITNYLLSIKSEITVDYSVTSDDCRSSIIQLQVVEQEVQCNNHYNELLTLFNTYKQEPAKVKDKTKLRDQILDILIPKVKAGEIKGRMQRGKQKLEEVAKMITNSTTKEQLASDLVSWLGDYVTKREKRNRVKQGEVIEIEVVEETQQVAEEVIQVNDETQVLEERLKILSEGLNTEYYISENNKVYVVGRLGRNGELSRKNVNELRKKKKDIYFNLLQNKNLTVVQMFGFDDNDLLFAQKLLDNNIDVQLVKGYKVKGMSYQAIMFNSQDRINEFYESDDEEIVIEGKHNKYSRNGCTQKQIDLFCSLGGEIIINNPKYRRVNATFTISQMSTAIDLIKAGYSVVLQDKYLKQR